MRLFFILILLVALVCIGQTSSNPTIKVASDGIERVVVNSVRAAVQAVQNWAEKNESVNESVSETDSNEDLKILNSGVSGKLTEKERREIVLAQHRIIHSRPGSKSKTCGQCRALLR